MCEYCREKDEEIYGKAITTDEWQETAGHKERKQPNPFNAYHFLEMFVLKGKLDKKAGLIIDTGFGARYIDISYCPFCGRKLGE